MAMSLEQQEIFFSWMESPFLRLVYWATVSLGDNRLIFFRDFGLRKNAENRHGVFCGTLLSHVFKSLNDVLNFELGIANAIS